MTFAETVNRVIELSAARRDYMEREMPKYHPEYPLAYEGEPDPPPPPEEAELRALLESLPVEDLNRLGALMYYGRKYSPKADLGAMYRRFVEDFPEPDWAAERLSRYSPLGDYLLDALEVLPKAGLGLDAVRAVPA
ncbi:MAG: DUF3775 domain-containing protein [Gemmataceae bacterium]|nr:DUF3775 domain-containing protein [Gemmataceae bacterium]